MGHMTITTMYAGTTIPSLGLRISLVCYLGTFYRKEVGTPAPGVL